MGGAHRRAAFRPAVRDGSVQDHPALVRAADGDRRPRLQPPARLHRAPVLRPLGVLRRGRLCSGADVQVPARPVDGAVPTRGDPGLARGQRALRLRLRAVHAHLLRHPHAGALAGAVEPGVQVLPDHGRDRRPPGADADAPGPPDRHRGRQDPFPRAQLLLLRARVLPRLRAGDVGHRALALREGAASDPRQRDARGVHRHPHPALPVRCLPRLRGVHRDRRRALGTPERADHAGHPLLAVLGRDRLHDCARRLPHLLGPHHRRGRLQLPEDLRRGLHDLLAGVARRDPGVPRARPILVFLVLALPAGIVGTVVQLIPLARKRLSR